MILEIYRGYKIITSARCIKIELYPALNFPSIVAARKAIDRNYHKIGEGTDKKSVTRFGRKPVIVSISNLRGEILFTGDIKSSAIFCSCDDVTIRLAVKEKREFKGKYKARLLNLI